MRYQQVIWILPVLLMASCFGHKEIQMNHGHKGTSEVQTGASGPAVFTLSPGDEIAINIWRNNDLNRNVKIDPSGNISLPLAGEVRSAGLTPAELKERITSRLSKYILNPQVDVNILNLAGQQVHILGEVRSPGSITLNKRMAAWEAISMAGGFTNDANMKKVILARAGEGGVKVDLLDIDMNAMLKQGQIDENVYLRKGDILYVPPRVIASIERFMIRLENMIKPLVSLERGIVLKPNVIDALQGEEKESVIVVPP